MKPKRQAGSIRELSPGKWLVQATYYLKDPHGNFVLDEAGRKIQKRLTSREPTTERAARRKLLELMDQADHMHEVEVVKTKIEATMKFGTFLEVKWIPFVRNRTGADASPATAMAYEKNLRHHVLPYDVIADVACWDLDCLKMDDWMTALRQARPHLKETTLQGILDAVRVACRQAVAWKLMPQDPTAGMGNKPHPRRYRKHEITTEEANTLMAAFWDHPQGLAFALVLACGLRPGEVCALRWCDFDFEAETVTPVRNIAYADGGGLKVCQTKTEDSAVTVEIPHKLMPLVRKHRRARMSQNLAWGLDGALIVSQKDGSPQWPKALAATFGVLRKSLGLPAMRLYDCRHAFVNLQLDTGASVYDVSKAARHSRVAMTEKFYANDSKGRRRELADRLGDLILPQEEAEG